MRATDEQIRQGILHPERLVRDAAVRYFAKSYSPDPAAMPLAVHAVETFGWEQAFEYELNLSRLVQTEPTLRWAVERMERIGYPETGQASKECLGLATIIVNADAALLAGCQQQVKALKGLHPQHRVLMAERVRLLGRDPETCWKDLEAWCQRNRRIRYIDKADVPAAQRLVKAIARGGDSYKERVLAILSQKIDNYEDNPMVWMECFAAQLAGEFRLDAAAPLLAAKLREDGGDMLNEDSMYSLTKIGTDAAVDAICDHWPDEPGHFKLYGSSALEHIHTDATVRKCLALFPEEGDWSLRVRLLRAVLTSFATDGIEPARQFILDGGGDLASEVVVAAILTGVSFPEQEQWMADEKAEAESRREHRNKLLSPPANGAKQKFPSLAGLGEPPPPPILKKEQVGRNDPCPCGSGKKYKKCCMNKA